jgi:penicillin-binding protein A
VNPTFVPLRRARLLPALVLLLSLGAPGPAHAGPEADLDRLLFPEAAEGAPSDPVAPSSPASADSESRSARGAGDRRLPPPIAGARPLRPEEDLLALARPDDAGRLCLAGTEGRRVLTVEPALQGALTRLLETYQPPYAALVVLEPATGRVLAMAEHSHADPALRGLPTKAISPAA